MAISYSEADKAQLRQALKKMVFIEGAFLQLDETGNVYPVWGKDGNFASDRFPIHIWDTENGGTLRDILCNHKPYADANWVDTKVEEIQTLASQAPDNFATASFLDQNVINILLRDELLREVELITSHYANNHASQGKIYIANEIISSALASEFSEANLDFSKLGGLYSQEYQNIYLVNSYPSIVRVAAVIEELYHFADNLMAPSGHEFFSVSKQDGVDSRLIEAQISELKRIIGLIPSADININYQQSLKHLPGK